MAKNNNSPKQLSPENYIRQKARNLPIYECLINPDWKYKGMATVSVARKHANGNITAGVFLVDLCCLGIKDAFYFFNTEESEYKEIVTRSGKVFLTTIDYVLAHNIIFAAIEFAEEFGFKPHKDFALAKYILEEDTEDIEVIEIECGKNGIPFYTQGPSENDHQANRIIAQLERTAGAGNYRFITASDIEDEGEFDELDDEFDDEYEENNEEFEDFNIEELKSLFEDFQSRGDNLSAADLLKYFDLVEHVMYDITDKDETDDYLCVLENELDIEISSDDELPQHIWGTENIEIEITEEMDLLFLYVLDNIDDNIAEAQHKLAQLKEMVGEDVAGIAYLELLVLQAQSYGTSEEFINMLIEKRNQFPEYMIFKLLYDNFINMDEIILTQETPPSLKQYFGDDVSIVHELEAYNYFLLLIKYLTINEDINKIWALDFYLSEMEVELPDYMAGKIFTLIDNLKKIIVADYFENN